jgi:hypothetical protein
MKNIVFSFEFSDLLIFIASFALSGFIIQFFPSQWTVVFFPSQWDCRTSLRLAEIAPGLLFPLIDELTEPLIFKDVGAM